jgi:transcriptional regulator with XRE-family HTH domain
MATLKEDVGKRLKESRKYAGLSQRQAAEHLGILQPAYARYESGVIELDYQKLTELCKLFDVSADYLLGLRDEYNQKLY